MSASGRTRSPLLEALIGVIRPEFRADTLAFSATDPVFGGGICRVGGCLRSARGQGLCAGHHLRWVDEGRGDLDAFAASTDTRWRRQRPNAVCQVGPCGYGVARAGLCQLHFQRWDRGGRPELEGWLSDPPPVKAPQPGSCCAVGHCDLWPRAALPLCHAHASTWKAHGRPDVEHFAASFAETAPLADETIRLEALPAQLKLEIQYALQCRRDERATKVSPAVVMQVVRFLAPGTASTTVAMTTVVSLLDRSEDAWRGLIGRPAPKDANPRAFVVYARRRIADLADADGWQGEFGRDDEEIDALVVDQQLRVAPAPWLFPRPTKNPDGAAPIVASTYRGALYRWLRLCNIADAQGRPVHLTPHQWRHTLGTRLINRDVPQEVVRRILDHDSPQMTAHYARLHDTTVRRHWEAARKIDITGKTVTVDPDGPLAEAAWAKQRLGRATQRPTAFVACRSSRRARTPTPA